MRARTIAAGLAVAALILPLAGCGGDSGGGDAKTIKVVYRNYSDFPLWDMLMGTFVNPQSFDGDVGFAGDAPRRVGAMLLFRDVNPPRRRQPANTSALLS